MWESAGDVVVNPFNLPRTGWCLGAPGGHPVDEGDEEGDANPESGEAGHADEGGHGDFEVGVVDELAGRRGLDAFGEHVGFGLVGLGVVDGRWEAAHDGGDEPVEGRAEEPEPLVSDA